jgi:enoyl-CoA hydratase
MAQRVATLPPDIVQVNKRTVHRGMEISGLRAAIRSGTELCTIGTHQPSFHEFIAKMRGGLTDALQERDKPFGDYRTGGGE